MSGAPESFDVKVGDFGAFRFGAKLTAETLRSRGKVKVRRLRAKLTAERLRSQGKVKVLLGDQSS